MKKLSPILQELEEVRESHGLSMGELQLYIGCSVKTVYNWLTYRTSEPSLLWRREIRRAIRKIKNEGAGPNEQKREKEIGQVFDLVWAKLTKAEKDELLGMVRLGVGSYPPEYLGRLKALAAIHKVDLSPAERERTSEGRLVQFQGFARKKGTAK